MYRTKTCGELRIQNVGEQVTLAGWVQRSRKMGGMTFIDLRDRYGLTQLVFNQETDAPLCERANKLGREFVIQEIWSRMILYNFCMEIVNQAVLKKQGCKYVYRINIAQALKTCHEFLRACRYVRKSIDVIGWILKADPCPVREGRNFPRKKKHQGAQSFNYR